MNVHGLSFASCEPIIFLYNIINVIHNSIVPQLLLKKMCLREVRNNATSCDDLENISYDIHQEASTWWFYILLSYQLPAIVTILVWGPLTDFFGRKKALLFVPCADAICSLVGIFSSYYLDSHPGYLIIGYVAISLFGQLQGVLSICYAYTADITEGKIVERTPRMAIVEASLYFSGVPAGLLSGYLIHALGFIAVFALTIGIDFLLFAYVFCLLTENKSSRADPDNERRVLLEDCLQENGEDAKRSVSDGGSVTLKRNLVNSKSDIRNGEGDLLTESNGKTNVISTNRRKLSFSRSIQQIRDLWKEILGDKIIIALIISYTLILCAIFGDITIESLYLKSKPFLFSAQQIGYYVAAKAASRGFGTILITQLSYRLLNLSDFCLIMISNVSQIINYVSIGFSRSKLALYLSCCIGGLAIPISLTTIRSVTTKKVSNDKYGTFLSAVTSINIAGAAIANVITHSMFVNRSLSFTGSVYIGLAGISALSLVIVIVTFILSERQRSVHDEIS